MKTIREVLAEGTSLLKNSPEASETPFLDALVLLTYVLGISKEKLLASYPDKISRAHYEPFFNLLNKRIENCPVSYLIKKKEFFGLSFYVDENVLVPRPDSEILVETAVKIVEDFPRIKNILDLCTGSGALAIALKHTIPHLNILCSDLSNTAIEICRKNSTSILGKELKVIESNLFDKIDGTFDMIITNPPYLTDEETDRMMKAGWPEPVMALKGGKDGLNFIREIISEAPDFLNKDGYLLIESSIDQTELIKDMLDSADFYNTRIIKDLSGRNRVTAGQRV